MLRNVILVLAMTAALPALGAPVVADVSFTAEVTTPVKDWTFDGKGAVAKGDDQGDVTMKLADMKTGMEGRDEHMLKVLDAAKYPEAKLHVSTHTAASFSGELTVHGVTKPVSGKVDGKTATFDVKLSDYGVTQESMHKPGLQVKDVVHVKVVAK
jgi:polyisoprenoid-binding protein YceI